MSFFTFQDEHWSHHAYNIRLTDHLRIVCINNFMHLSLVIITNLNSFVQKYWHIRVSTSFLSSLSLSPLTLYPPSLPLPVSHVHQVSAAGAYVCLTLWVLKPGLWDQLCEIYRQIMIQARGRPNPSHLIIVVPGGGGDQATRHWPSLGMYGSCFLEVTTFKSLPFF